MCDHDWRDCAWEQKDRETLAKLFAEVGKNSCAPGRLRRCSRCGQYAMEVVIPPEVEQVALEVRA